MPVTQVEKRHIRNEIGQAKFRQGLRACGVLELPSGMDLSRVTWRWVSNGVPWIDPLKEVQADGLAVDRGFESTVGICRQMGQRRTALCRSPVKSCVTLWIIYWPIKR